MRRIWAVGGWWQSLTLGLIAAAIRLPRLSQPHAIIFDETYYAKDAWSLWKFGYEVQAQQNADQKILAGIPDFLTTRASYVVHPPVGKWMIGLGEHFFGMNPFGWRIVVCTMGILAVVAVHRIARRLFHHELTAFIAGLLMAVDGMAIVQSRTALLDQTLMFFTLLAFGAVVLDRDRVAVKLARDPSNSKLNAGFRPWLLVASVFLALAIGTKWSALWFVVGCGVCVVFFTARTRMSLGHERPWRRAFFFDTLPWLPAILAILVVVYLASWTGWFVSQHAWNRDWAALNPKEGLQFLPEALRSLINYHQSAWNFHVGLRSPHTYSANPWTWPLQLRPTSFFYESYSTGKGGCDSAPCAAEVLAVGNPLIWWAGSLALLHQAWRAVTRRETRAAAIVVMFLVGWAPWLLFQQRTVFTFYSIVMLPFIVFALAGSLGVMLGEADVIGRIRHRRAFIVGGFIFAVIVVSGLFLPLWTGQTISYHFWQVHMWLESWI